MTEILLIIIAVLLLVNLFLSYRAGGRGVQGDFQPMIASLNKIETSQSRLEGAVRDEFSRNREENSRGAKETREELTNSFQTLGDSVSTRMGQIAEMQKGQLDSFANSLTTLTRTNDERLGKLTDTLGTKLDAFQSSMSSSAKSNRDELTNSLQRLGESVATRMAQIAEMQKTQLETFSNNLNALTRTNEDKLTALTNSLSGKLDSFQVAMGATAKSNRDELTNSFQKLGESVSTRMGQIAEMQKNQLETFSNNLSTLTRTNEEKLTTLTNSLGTKLDSISTRMESSAKVSRDELASSLKSFQEQFKASVTEFNELQRQKFDNLTAKQAELLQTTERRLEKMREVIEAKLKSIQDDNSEKLERMRQTVDEKLQKTLEERLGESFKLVSDRLEQVHKGLGEMQTLASGVGDLKKVLANVRTRGSLGEYRLEMILEQILAPEQYAKAVATKPESRENVEFVVKLPSKDSDNEILLLPVDSKFPQDKYQSLLDAYDKADPVLVELAIKELDKTIKGLAKNISEKYINPPVTTDFAIMFLPFEGLYAEVVKRPALFESLQKDFRVTVVGPSTFAAFLHSLYMGFRTLAIQKRSSEVWALLGAVKTDFGKFATVLDGVEKNLQSASNKIHDAGRKSRSIERKLKGVETLAPADVVKLLGDGSDDQEDVVDQTVVQQP